MVHIARVYERRREGTDAAEAIGDDVCAEDESPHESALEANIRELNAKFVAIITERINR